MQALGVISRLTQVHYGPSLPRRPHRYYSVLTCACRASKPHYGATANRPVDLPDGLFGRLPVQPLCKKYFCSRATQITSKSPLSRPTEGRFAVVTDAGRDAVDAGGAADESAGLRTAKSCGPDAPTLAFKLVEVSTDDGDKKSPVTGEITKETVKTIACGNAG
jgi:hypothetical protein